MIAVEQLLSVFLNCVVFRIEELDDIKILFNKIKS